jgi:hypothetical protein
MSKQVHQGPSSSDDKPDRDAGSSLMVVFLFYVFYSLSPTVSLRLHGLVYVYFNVLAYFFQFTKEPLDFELRWRNKSLSFFCNLLSDTIGLDLIPVAYLAYCIFLIQISNKRLPFQNGVSAIFDGRCLISDQFVDDAHQNHQNNPFRTAYG